MDTVCADLRLLQDGGVRSVSQSFLMVQCLGPYLTGLEFSSTHYEGMDKGAGFIGLAGSVC